MKTKNKIYLFVAALFFLNVFFVRVDSVNNIAKAMDCYTLCADEVDMQGCYDDCAISNDGVTAWDDTGATTDTYVDDYLDPYADSNNGGGGYDFCANNYTDPNCCRTNGGYWYGNTCNTEPQKSDCSDYPNTHAVNGFCQCNDGYDRNSDGACSIGTGSVCSGNYETPGCCEANRGYWYNNECNTNANTGIVGNGCTNDAQCGSGYKCDPSGTCMADGFFSATECNTDGDCQSNYGSGYVCIGYLVKTCEKGAANGTKLPAGQPTITTTAPTNIINKNTGQPVAVPTGSTINTSTGAVYSSSGTELLPAGSVQLPSSLSSGSSFVMCANGSIAPECRNGNGDLIGGTPIVLGSSSSGLPGSSSFVGPPNMTAKCGADFQDIGGVCFPMKTGLSSAPIYVILSNLFSWLMGLFTTFAVIAFVVSGIQYFMASGDESMAEKAKENAVHAIIGIIVGLSGFIIIKAIAAALSGQSMFF